MHDEPRPLDQTPRKAWWPQLPALIIGLVYLLLGIGGFALADAAHVGRDTTNTFLIFSLGALLNVVHTIIGVLGVLAARRAPTAQLFGWVLFFVGIGLTVYGILAAATGREGDIMNINWADNWLHGISAVLGLSMGWFAVHRARDRQGPASSSGR